jgi:hypothetical protein
MKHRLPLALALLACFAPLVPAAGTVFEFGPSADLVAANTRFLGSDGRDIGWGGRRLFSEHTPLTPTQLRPAIYGGYELFNSGGAVGVFIDYSGSPTTGVNNNSFAGRTLDSIGVKSGFAVEPGQSRDVSFALAFLALGRPATPARFGPGFELGVRLNNRMIGEVPGSVRVVLRVGDRFYASDFERPLRSTADTTLRFTHAELSSARWFRYDPYSSIAFNDESPAALPERAAFDFAGVLVTRVVNAVNRTRSDFATVEIAELRVVAD